MQARALGGAGLVGPHDEIVAVAIRGEKAVHGARGERAVGDELVEHRICIGENFARLLAVFFVVEDLGIHATQFPGVEKRRPVNERAQLGEREIFQHAHAGKLRLRRIAELKLWRLQPCFLDAHELCRAARVLLSERLLIHGILRDEIRPAIRAQERTHDRHGARSIEHMHDRAVVVRRDFHRRVRARSRRAADEQRLLEGTAFHFLRDVRHLVERWRDESAEADDVRADLDGFVQNFVARDHHAHVHDLVVVTRQHDADDVLADVMHVAFHGREQHLALRLHDLAARGHRELFGLHVRLQPRDGFLHHARGLHDLRQKHFPRAEQIADDAHAVHERAFDDGERLAVLRERLGGVGFNVQIDPAYERVREALLDGSLAPFLLDLFVGCGRAAARGLQFFAMRHQPLRRIGAAVQQHVLDEFLQLRLDLLVHFEHPGIHDAHVHPGGDRVEKKRAVHRLAHRIVAAETKRNIRHAAAHLRIRQVLFDPPRGLDEVHRVVVMLLDARADGEDVWIENDVLGWESDLVHEDAVRALADADFFRVGRRLPLLVECHHDDRRAVFQNVPRVLFEFLLTSLQRDRIHDAFSLQTFQSRLDDFPLRRVHHERHLRHVRLHAEHVEEARHRGDAINHPFVHADVYDVGPVLHLLLRNRDGFLVFVLLDELRKFRRTGDVCALTDHQETADLLRECFGAREAQRQCGSSGKFRLFANLARPAGGDRLCNCGDVLRRVAAAAARDVQHAAFGEITEVAGHVFRLQIKACRRQRIRQSGIRICGDVGAGFLRELRQKWTHQVRPERAVEPDGKRFQMLHRIPVSLHFLRRHEGLTAAPDRCGDHHRQHDTVLFKDLLNRDQCGFCIQRIENRLHQNHIRTASDQSADVLHVGRLHLLKCARAEARVVRVRGKAQRHLHGPDRAGDEALPPRLIRHAIGLLAALARGGLAHFPREFVEEFVLDDLLEKLRILPPAMLARILDEEIAQGDRGHAEGVRLNDVRARFEEAAVDVADHLRLREREKVAAV